MPLKLRQRYRIFLVAPLFLAGFADPAPQVSVAEAEGVDAQISGIWGPRGAGSEVTILGQGFGTISVEVESSLGPQGWIETNASGTKFPDMVDAPGWSNGQQCFGGSFISDSRSYSGSQSVMTYIGDRTPGLCENPHCWQGAYNYDHGKPFDKVFASFRLYFEPIELSSGRTQFKLWRVNATGINGINSSEEIYSRLRYTGREASFYDWGTTLYCKLDCDPSPFQISDQYCAQNLIAIPEWDDPPAPTMKNYYARYHHHVGSNYVGYEKTMPAPGTWNRIDVYLDSSDEDQFNGAYSLAIQRPGETRKLLINVSGLGTHSSEVCRPGTEGPWRYWVFQNYVDDDGGSFASERANIYIDDIYLQFGTAARAELGNAPSLEACTRLEVQETVEWSDDRIKIRLNHGGFEPAAQVWMFVISANGRISPGMPVRLE